MPGEWTKLGAPSPATRASATQAAAGADLRNICNGIVVAISQPTSSPVAYSSRIFVRDGDITSTNLLWGIGIGCPAVAGDCRVFTFNNLRIKGTANTQMTVDFETAPGTGVRQTVFISGDEESE
jgi:hypothetical protein